MEQNGNESAAPDGSKSSKRDTIAGCSIIAVPVTLVIGGLTWGGDDEYVCIFITGIHIGDLDFMADELLAIWYSLEARIFHFEILVSAMMNAFAARAVNGVAKFDADELALANGAIP